MSDSDDELIDNLAGGSAGLIPIVGPVVAPLGTWMFKNLRAEWARNNSKALRAAERISKLSREDLADRINEEPRLIPLITRVLYAAGMTGQDTILTALGAALGHAVVNAEKIDETELLLAGMADLRNHHIVVLKIMRNVLPHPTEPDSFLYWTIQPLVEKTGYSRDITIMCVAGLVRSGLIHQAEDAYGVAYEITDLGRTALDVLDELSKEE